MKTLIAYASKTGTTEKCARTLAEKIPNATLVDPVSYTHLSPGAERGWIIVGIAPMRFKA